MKVEVLDIYGKKEAILGLSLSYNTTIAKAGEVALKLWNKDGGHNNFLESIIVWFDINAPRYWWSQMDRYRLKTQQSESTMHTLLKRRLTNDDFEIPIPSGILNELNWAINNDELHTAKALLPESFLQRRVVTMSVKTMKNILLQRRNHKLSEWQLFCKEAARVEDMIMRG